MWYICTEHVITGSICKLSSSFYVSHYDYYYYCCHYIIARSVEPPCDRRVLSQACLFSSATAPPSSFYMYMPPRQYFMTQHEREKHVQQLFARGPLRRSWDSTLIYSRLKTDTSWDHHHTLKQNSSTQYKTHRLSWDLYCCTLQKNDSKKQDARVLLPYYVVWVL